MIKVSTLKREYSKTLAQLHERCFPAFHQAEPDSYSEARIIHLSETFPQGSFVALDNDGKILGAALGILTPNFNPDKPQVPVHIQPTPENSHNSFYLYVLSVFVDPDYQNQGVGTALYQARRQFVQANNLKGLIAFGIPAGYEGYEEHSSNLSPDQYLHNVLSGRIYDTTLSFQFNQGYMPLTIIPEIIPGVWGVFILNANFYYDPDVPAFFFDELRRSL